MADMIEKYDRPYTYAVWSKDKEIRFCSTSGGAFTEFAKGIIEKQGVVVGAAYNDDNMVEHIMVNNVDDLEKIRQSKYISSSIGDVYLKVKEKLNDGVLVGFCGSPCQIAGLKSFLKKDYDNLITMDFICRGMNSPKALKSWLSEIEQLEGKKIARVWFKYKEGGWKSSPTRTRLDFDDGSYVVKDGEDNLFMKGYLTSNFYIRPSCGNCKFKGIPRKSDITFADFWGIDEIFDDDKGTSMLLINTNNGNKLFQSIKESLYVNEKDFDSVIKGNPMLLSSANVPLRGRDFLKDLDNMSFSECFKKYSKESSIKKICKKIKMKIKYIVKS